MAAMRNVVLLLAILAVGIPNSKAFGVTKSFLSRNKSPKVQHIPGIPFSGVSRLDSAIDANEKECKKLRAPRFNPLPQIRHSFKSLQKGKGTKTSRRTLLISFASLLVTLVARPTLALAMGGGMGGPKGPVAPMQR